MNLTINDKREMKRMEYTHRAWFISPTGVPFHKDFTSGERMEEFIYKAQEAGTKLRGFASL